MGSFKLTQSGLGATIKGLESLRNDAERSKMMSYLGAEQVLHIKDRTRKLQSHTDTSFPASKTKRNGKSSTTLWDTGNMMKAMGVTAFTASKATISFAGAAEMKKAVWNQNGTKEFTVAKGKAFPIEINGKKTFRRHKAATPPRPFFGVSPNDMKKLMEKANGAFLGIIKKAGLYV